VWSWALGAGETYESLATSFNIGGQDAPIEPISIASLDGFRVEQADLDEEGDTYVWVRWVLFDRQFEDVHLLSAAVYPEEIEKFNADINELLQNATWIPAE
jgi:hypothetical protein